MRRVTIWLVVLFSAASRLHAEGAAAVIVEMEKKVETQPRGNAWRAATIGEQLAAEDRMRTGEFSRASIRLSDLTTMRLDELTTIEISQLIAAGKAGALDVKSGAIYFLNRGKPQEMKIRTAAANGALKGTEFALRVGADGKTTLAMFEGEVVLSNASGSVTLKSGEIGEVEIGRAPRKTPMIDAISNIQWCLYYPAVIDPRDFHAQKNAARDAYRAGDLPHALELQSTENERAFRAALILSSGQVAKAREALAALNADDPARLAIERLIAAVQHREWKGGEPKTASEWLAESYYKQSRGELVAALEATRKATQLSPDFGFAWERAAEMEFSFGRTLKAMKLLERSLELSPRNAQALALQGFLLSAENHTGAARRSFDEAIARDGALGNAWLGRGLTSIRQGRDEAGRLDLQTAALLEPDRSLLRSYLGKAFSQVGYNDKANTELARAKELDANDPTPWLYSAIERKQENRYNEAVADLEKSVELNENRGLFRSQFLLDQDRAIRGANLAAIYRNDGMPEQSVREAVRAVDADYSSAPAHLFLSNSYDALRDPTGVLLRYESGTFSELLVSNLLAPVGGGPLSQFVSQQEYSKLFESDGIGFASDFEYFSDGRVRETASQFGTTGNLSYAIDGYYFYDHGTRPNNRLSNAGGFGTFKLQLGPQDSIFFQTQAGNEATGNLTQMYDPNAVSLSRAALTQHSDEKEDPGLLLLGWHHEWSPGNHTILLLGRLADRQAESADDTTQSILRRDVTLVAPPGFVDGAILGTIPRDAAFYANAQKLAGRGLLYSNESGTFDLGYHSDFEIYTAELQHIATIGPDTLIVGGRYQRGEFDTSVRLTNFDNGLDPFDEPLFKTPPADQSESVDFERISFYAYDTLHLAPWLSVTGGVTYDDIHYPDNFRSAPINGRQDALDRVSPKAGFILQPWRGAALRGAYTEGVSGASFDESFQLEPTQVAGFLQSYRSLISESLVGELAGSKFKLSGLSFEQKLPTRTYFGVEFKVLEQNLDRSTGVFESLDSEFVPLAIVPSSLGERDRYRENVITTTVNQLIGNEWSVGANYKYTRSRFRQTFDGFDDAIARGGEQLFLDGLVSDSRRDMRADLHQVSLFAIYNHPSGFFARAEANWFQQDNDANVTSATYTPIDAYGDVKAHVKTSNVGLPGDDFWQFNFVAGWRFHRNQCEVSCGLLNITGQDYRLSPLNPYEELPRDRTIVVRCRLDF